MGNSVGVDVTANFVRVVFLHHSSGVAGTTDPTTVPVSTNNSSVAQDEEDLNTGARPLNSLLQSPLSPAADLPCGGGHASDRLEFRCPPGVCCAHGNAKAFVDAVLSGELPAVEFKRLDGMSSTSGLPEDLLYRQEEAPEPPGCLQMTSSSKLVDIHSDRYEKHSGDQFVVEEGFAYMEYKSQPPAKNRLERSHESTRGGRSESQTSGSLLSLSEIYFWGLLFEDAVAIIDKVVQFLPSRVHVALTGNGSVSFKCLIEERIAVHTAACNLLEDWCVSSSPLVVSNEEGINDASPSWGEQGSFGGAGRGLRASFSFERESMCLIGALDFLLHFFPATFFKYTGSLSEGDFASLYPYLLLNLKAGVSFHRVVGGPFSYSSPVLSTSPTLHRNAQPTKDENVDANRRVNFQTWSMKSEYFSDCSANELPISQRIGSSTIGGATFMGLCRLLLRSVGLPHELVTLAQEGDNRRVDMLVKDIYGGNYAAIGLKGNTIASTFGKMQHARLSEAHTGCHYNCGCRGGASGTATQSDENEQGVSSREKTERGILVRRETVCERQNDALSAGDRSEKRREDDMGHTPRLPGVSVESLNASTSVSNNRERRCFSSEGVEIGQQFSGQRVQFPKAVELDPTSQCACGGYCCCCCSCACSREAVATNPTLPTTDVCWCCSSCCSSSCGDSFGEAWSECSSILDHPTNMDSCCCSDAGGGCCSGTGNEPPQCSTYSDCDACAWPVITRTRDQAPPDSCGWLKDREWIRSRSLHCEECEKGGSLSNNGKRAAPAECKACIEKLQPPCHTGSLCRSLRTLDVEDKPTEADVVRSLLAMMSFNLAQQSFLHAVMHRLDKIVLVGFLEAPCFLVSMQHSINFWSQSSCTIVFCRLSCFLGALGAALLHSAAAGRAGGSNSADRCEVAGFHLSSVGCRDAETPDLPSQRQGSAAVRLSTRPRWLACPSPTDVEASDTSHSGVGGAVGATAAKSSGMREAAILSACLPSRSPRTRKRNPGTSAAAFSPSTPTAFVPAFGELSRMSLPPQSVNNTLSRRPPFLPPPSSFRELVVVDKHAKLSGDEATSAVGEAASD